MNAPVCTGERTSKSLLNPLCMQDNHLNKDEMLAALQEVGLLNGIRAKHVGEWGRAWQCGKWA
eukprot:1157298-Pelagomonas_calceolata.AAC.21